MFFILYVLYASGESFGCAKSAPIAPINERSSIFQQHHLILANEFILDNEGKEPTLLHRTALSVEEFTDMEFLSLRHEILNNFIVEHMRIVLDGKVCHASFIQHEDQMHIKIGDCSLYHNTPSIRITLKDGKNLKLHVFIRLYRKYL